MDDAISSVGGEPEPSVILINSARWMIPEIAAAIRLRERHPAAKIVLIEESPDAERMKGAIEAGLDGFLLETIQADAFMKHSS